MARREIDPRQVYPFNPNNPIIYPNYPYGAGVDLYAGYQQDRRSAWERLFGRQDIKRETQEALLYRGQYDPYSGQKRRDNVLHSLFGDQTKPPPSEYRQQLNSYEHAINPDEEDEGPSLGDALKSLFSSQDESSPQVPEQSLWEPERSRGYSFLNKLFGSQEEGPEEGSAFPNILSRLSPYGSEDAPQGYNPEQMSQGFDPQQRPKKRAWWEPLLAVAGIVKEAVTEYKPPAKTQPIVVISPDVDARARGMMPVQYAEPVVYQSVPRPEGVKTRGEQTEREYREYQNMLLQPRSSVFYHPQVMAIRSQLSHMPWRQRVAEAQRIIAGLKYQDHKKEVFDSALQEQMQAVQARRNLLYEHPLTTSGWNGYVKWKEEASHNAQSQMRKREQHKTVYVAKKLWGAGATYVKRFLDNSIASFQPRIIRSGKEWSVTIGDSHVDDQVIFNGSELLIVNPSTVNDVLSVQVDQVWGQIQFGVEGAAMLQGVANLLSQAQGTAYALTVLGRGFFIVRAQGRNEELVRVPLVDPQGFQRALVETINACQSVALPPIPQSQQQMMNPNDAAPIVLRDLLEAPNGKDAQPSAEEMQRVRRGLNALYKIAKGNMGQ